MLVQDIIDLAQKGELSSVAAAEDTAAVISYINLGLIELYKRFPITTSEYMLELVDGTSVYTMPSDFMWLVAAYDEVPTNATTTVMPIPLNEEDNPLSINTISWNQIQVPLTVNGAFISLIYITAPPFYTVNDVTATIPIPVQLVEALLHYIGYRAHGAMNGEIQAENNTHYQRFEASCNRVLQLGMFTPDDLSMTQRFLNRGFA